MCCLTQNNRKLLLFFIVFVQTIQAFNAAVPSFKVTQKQVAKHKLLKSQLLVNKSSNLEDNRINEQKTILASENLKPSAKVSTNDALIVPNIDHYNMTTTMKPKSKKKSPPSKNKTSTEKRETDKKTKYKPSILGRLAL